MPFLVRQYASWEELPFAEGVPLEGVKVYPPPPIVRNEEEEEIEEEEYSPYANGEISPAFFESAPLIPDELEGYYTHPKFSLLPRTNYKARVNFPESLTSPIGLF
jgi:hypothetical protein